ncbi:MAG: chromate efflux transporter [Vicinamibacterales bacterium]
MSPQPLKELAALFLRLGVTAFGGPAAHVAMMRDEVVSRRHWMTDAEFLDLLAATQLIPGPNSTEMAIHLGYKRAGLPGLVLAGVCFILPASLIVGVIAWGYTRYGETPQVVWLMYGISPVIIAIILQAVWKLARGAVTGVLPGVICAVTAALSLWGVNELALLAGGAGVSLVASLGRQSVAVWMLGGAGISAAVAGLAAMTASDPSVPVTLTRLTLFFLKVGSVLFGSGYVLLAFLRADLTTRWGWLTEQQLIDAVTVGQVTPGPVFTTATFIGFLLGGWMGAVLATLAIFVPGFVFVALTHPMIARLRGSRVASALLDGVVAASLGLMAAVSWHLGRSALVDLPTVLLLAGAGVALVGWRLNSTWIIAAGAAVGWLLGDTL